MTLPRATGPALLAAIGGLVLVVVAIVGRVPVPVVCVVHVARVRDGLVPAAFPVGVTVLVVGDVRQLVLVVVVPVADVGMALVDVIDVALMLDARVPAVRPVAVRVAGMNFVLGGGHYSSLL
jgi:hypothetical protein